MAQLSDDCFAGTEKLMGANDALRLLVERVTPITSPETVELKKAGGRTLAQDVSSSINVPQHTNSAVDGYAVYFTDLNFVISIDVHFTFKGRKIMIKVVSKTIVVVY